MPAPQKIVIVGATSAIAEHCARLWVEQKPSELILIVRSLERAERVAQDLKVRSPETRVLVLQSDFLDTQQIQAVVDQACTGSAVDIALIAHGSLPDQSACQADLSLSHNALALNGISPVLFAEAFAMHMQKTNRGTLAVIGSVAGDRGRKSNYIYGAAKGLLTRHVQGLQHRFARSNVHVVLIKPGPTDTPMTAHLKQRGNRLASVDRVARDIVTGIEKGSRIVYTPRVWLLIMLVIRHLPHFMFKHIDI